MLATLITTGVTITTVNSQSIDDRRTFFSIETDPSTFVLKGYALHFRVMPKSSKHLMLGAGTYALDMPDVMVDMNSENRNEGWNVRIRSAYSFFAEYYFNESATKWFAGLQGGVQNFRSTNDNFGRTEAKYRNLLVMPSLGYNWKPFQVPLYLKPWMGVGYTTKISGTNRIEGQKYDIASLIPFVTLHVGYSF
jgi:hypothetical protein